MRWWSLENTITVIVTVLFLIAAVIAFNSDESLKQQREDVELTE